jgi:NRAMP (natural resistance-associated macrophage protein)-like metal ion transporter
MAKKRQREPIVAASYFLKQLGPGLITGASDDDPSGIGTYSQAGAQLGFSIGWTMLLTFPLMAAIQEISARIGRTTGHGIAGNLRRHYPDWLLYPIVGLIFLANTINIGADLSAMGDALKLLIGGPSTIYAVLFGTVCAIAIVFMDYSRYVMVLKWLTLVLFAYVAALFTIHVPWDEALLGLLVPRITWNAAFLTTLVAIFGTTISPYLFFWQASQEAEDERVDLRAKPLVEAPQQAPEAFERIRADTLVGMAFSNIIALAIIFTTAATLNKAGITNIETSAQAAEALKPVAGNFAFVVFALGIIGTGLLAVPVLAGSAAYAVGEAFKWPVGLSRKPKHATAFYSILTAATVLGMGITLTPLDPIKALYWSAVINGVVAVPVMSVTMIITAQRKIMRKFIVSGWLRWLGWASTAAMAASVVGMIVGWL